MAIYKYNHAIGKTQSGGVQLGLLRDLYQSPVGKREPVDPAAIHAKKPNKKMKPTRTYRKIEKCQKKKKQMLKQRSSNK